MGRGRPAPVGKETVNANGYTQVKTKDRGWLGKHILIAEEKLGRQLRENERARFIDGNRYNLDPDNIDVIEVGGKSLKAKIADLNARIDDLVAQRDVLQAQLDKEQGGN